MPKGGPVAKGGTVPPPDAARVGHELGFAVDNRRAGPGGTGRREAYTEKLLPQPHERVTFGLLNVKPRFSRPS